MFENVRKTKTIRRRSRKWLSRRQIEEVQECTKDEDYKMKMTEDVPTEIDDEDVTQCSKTSYDI